MSLQRSTILKQFLFGAFLALPAFAQTPSVSDSFDREIRPVVSRYCLTCHSAAKHVGDLNLERFTSLETVIQDPRVWQKVSDQLSLGEMPPKGMPQPSPEERLRLLASVASVLKTAAGTRAGDPGPVVLRRLNNAEYTFTVRDLTGVQSLDPAKEFPADGAAGEGFMNTGNALAMSPSLVTKYMDAAKVIAGHAVLLPDGVRFSRFTSRRDWTDELLTEIRDFYKGFTEPSGTGTVRQQGMALDIGQGGVIPLRRYLSASLSLRGVTAPAAIDRVARQNNLSAKYLTVLVNLLNSSQPSPILDGLRSRWRTAKSSDIDGLVKEITTWQQALWKFSSVGHIGKVDGPKSWMEAVTPVVDQQEFRLNLTPANGSREVTLYLTAHNAGDGAVGDVVLWREPKLVIPGRPAVPLRDVRALVDTLTERRKRMFPSTATALNAAAELGVSPVDTAVIASRIGVDPDDLKAWFGYLGVGPQPDFKLDLLTSKIEKTGAYDFVQGWGTSKTPMLLANASNEHVRIPGNMKARGVAVHPSPTQSVGVGWRSLESAAIRIEGQVARAQVECGNGVTWSLQLRRGTTRQYLAQGEARIAAPVTIGPLDGIRVQPGDLISVLVDPREGNHACDLTAIDLRLTDAGSTPKHGRSQTMLPATCSPAIRIADSSGTADVWRFYTEPVTSDGSDSIIPANSLACPVAFRQIAGGETGVGATDRRLLTGPPPANARLPMESSTSAHFARRTIVCGC